MLASLIRITTILLVMITKLVTTSLTLLIWNVILVLFIIRIVLVLFTLIAIVLIWIVLVLFLPWCLLLWDFVLIWKWGILIFLIICSPWTRVYCLCFLCWLSISPCFLLSFRFVVALSSLRLFLLLVWLLLFRWHSKFVR
jgi:hypothetical protein